MSKQVQLHKLDLYSNSFIGYLAFMTVGTLNNKSSSRKKIGKKFLSQSA